ncbi:uncharacterized protein BYT42DRAFT_555795 [Radiomyces spectabilis]|uniref:uncharacterized protein n=1 Tax=Radiomyces spectabilis TaxID=64574 RepID=UPI00221F0682|nr:uncharacterized protein BYT42DRAFT_555795 [Radiomyces spectabilis]KAI8391149.1 hypothetical protein BYT42DRAFT_555795 [Radiomyces spectabilis]
MPLHCIIVCHTRYCLVFTCKVLQMYATNDVRDAFFFNLFISLELYFILFSISLLHFIVLMTALVSTVLSYADKVPVLNQATSWLPASYHHDKKASTFHHVDRTSLAMHFAATDPSPLPPSYENVVSQSRLSRLSQMIWKQTSTDVSDYGLKQPCPAQQPFMNRKDLERAMALIHIANEMEQSNNRMMAMDLYLMALDRFMEAIPVDTDANVRHALTQNIMEFRKRHDLSFDEISHEHLGTATEAEQAKSEQETTSTLSNLIVNTAVFTAIALKKSFIPSKPYRYISLCYFGLPLIRLIYPDVMSSAIDYCKMGLDTIDETCQIRQHTWNMAAQGIAKIVQVDQQYELHQTLANIMYIGCTAFFKAGVAYAETPGYGETPKSTSGNKA